ncbi:MAG: T9SS type A sorting domain-containing protein [Candidatus Latescibacterota bacterium]
MKKVFIFGCVLLLAASGVFAANFAPTLLKLSAPSQVKYNFDGSTLAIPVTVSGKPANTIFMVYTKDKGPGIGKVKNGHLGWHYVNKIDTCIFLAPAKQLTVGSGQISWDGKDTYGKKAAPGDYTYYLWAYDNQTPKQLALKALGIGGLGYTEARDAKGIPLASPILYIGLTKWPLGIDPMTDASQFEKTTLRTGITKWGSDISLDPEDHSKFYAGEINAGKTLFITKYKWVPNGQSTVESSWATDGTFTWSTQPAGAGTFGPGVVGDGKDLLFMSFVNQYDKEPVSQLLFLGRDDGTKLKIVDLADYYCSKDDSDKAGQMNGGPSQVNFRNNRLFTQGQQSCMALALDPYREDGDEIIWVNDNGDYVHDYHFEPNDKTPWMCNDFMVGPYMYTYSVDANEFCAFPAYDLGAVTFGLFGPSGTGIGYLALAGETAGWKKTARFLDEGTAFDGMYFDNDSADVDADGKKGSWFVGHDSIKGVITNQVGVADGNPAVFTVAQNTPNPFNPTTTISFTLAKAGQTTVEVFNVAGQRVDTILNASLNAGAHTVTWNAARRSAGVYFYTVRSGSSSRTMKMTLLK